MQIEIFDPIFQTWVFTGLLCLALLLTIRRIKIQTFFPTQLSTEIKGFAILAIVLAHTGYYLSKNTQYLFPLSVLAGVGVNLFFFLAGYGLAVSSLRNEINIKAFYLKRLRRLFVPLWLAITILFILDFIIHQKNYGFVTLIESYLGFYPKADLFLSFNAPLWYFTMILFYYLAFPLVFLKRIRIISPLLIYLVFTGVLFLPLPLGGDIINLYKVHSLSFPLGMGLALLVFHNKLPTFKLSKIIKVVLLAGLVFLVGYLALNSGVGHGVDIEQALSTIATLAIVLIGLLKPVRIIFLELLGTYSYEIYLFHWPILYRYDFLYKILPAGLATFVYLGVFMALGWFFQKLLRRFA